MRRSPLRTDEPSLESRLFELDAQLRRFEGALRAQQQSHGRARTLELELASVVERAAAIVRDLTDVRAEVRRTADAATRDAIAESAGRVQEFEQRAARILDAYAAAVRAAQQAVARAEARIDAFDERVGHELSQAAREIREAAALLRDRPFDSRAPALARGGPIESRVPWLAQGRPLRVVPMLLTAALLLAALAGYNWLSRTLRDAAARADAAEQRAEAASRGANQQIAAVERNARQGASDALATAARADRVASVLAAPDVQRVPLRALRSAAGASGQVLWSPSRGVAATAAGLPKLAAGEAYQVWLVTPRDSISLGFLSPDARGQTTVAFDLPPRLAGTIRGFMVTREPAGGAARPSRSVVLAS